MLGRSLLMKASGQARLTPVVSLLLHGNGTNGSTTIIDSSPTPKIVTALGNAQISTAIADPFGNSSSGVIAFDGAGDYLDCGSNADFALGSENYTLECWFRSNANQVVNAALFYFGGFGTTATFVGLTSNVVRWFVFGGSSNDLITSSFGAHLAWVHLAAVRNGNLFSLYLNGTLAGSLTRTPNLSSQTLKIGGDNAFFNGQMGEIRIQKGVALYTDNFTPPPAPFPNP